MWVHRPPFSNRWMCFCEKSRNGCHFYWHSGETNKPPLPPPLGSFKEAGAGTSHWTQTLESEAQIVYNSLPCLTCAYCCVPSKKCKKWMNPPQTQCLVPPAQVLNAAPEFQLFSFVTVGNMQLLWYVIVLSPKPKFTIRGQQHICVCLRVWICMYIYRERLPISL